MLSTVAFRGYRSLRDVVLPLGRLTLVTGANGTGKSSVYRALRLLADCGRGEVIGSLARDPLPASKRAAAPHRLFIGPARRADWRPPSRRVKVGTRTPTLSDDGADVAAAIQTIVEAGSGAGSGELQRAVADAFSGASVSVVATDGVFDLQVRQPGMLRPLRASELSDGTLRFLLWAAALLAPEPPSLMVLNEPETSLHPDLIGPLAMLVRAAAATTQTVVVTQAR